MSRSSDQPEDSIFAAALAHDDPQQRATFLAEACGEDRSLRARIEDLLRHHAAADRFLESPSPAFSPTVVESPIRESPGAVIGPYKLLEQIGEGGFGVVFVAEQTAPVKRKVALKVIKPGMDTRQVVARFEAERQALALMDHPHIAKVLDGGETATGRPYFVMELVQGPPITDYCDQHQLAPRERLELFLSVCQAVQHAHQKGIIHRDIKPSNVLVSVHDDKPVVKVIDFGVAKAISGPLTDKTLFTGYSQMIGTPLYMSPEQAALSGVDVDTRTDIYSLGVLLYELLTGTTPFDRSRLRAAAFEEIRRIIREEEPQKPSTRLSELSRSGQLGRTDVKGHAPSDYHSSRQGTVVSLASVAALRKTEPRKLSQLVRGDLDWIVMKALEKDRTRRYETANGFALDVLRYLHDEPVLACPPSVGYRFSKFARRNKAALATAAVVALTLVAGIIGTSWQAIRATHEADRANTAEGLAQQRFVDERAARVQADAARVAEAKQRGIAQKETARAEEALKEVQEQKQQADENFAKALRVVDVYLTQVTESDLLTVPGLQPLREDLLKAALTFYAEFTQDRADDASLQQELAFAHFRLARIHSELGHQQETSTATGAAIRLFEKLRNEGQLDQDGQSGLAQAYSFGRRYDDAIQLANQILEADAAHAGARSLLADAYNALASAADDNDIETVFKYHRQAFELREALAREFPDDPRRLADVGGSMNNLALLLSKQGKHAESLAMLERALDYVGQAYERAPHSLLWAEWLWRILRNVATRQDALGQQEQALATWQRLVAISRKRVFDNPAVTSLRTSLYQAHVYLAQYQQKLGNSRDAARSFRDARDVLQNMPRETPQQIYVLATAYAILARSPDETGLTNPEDADEQQRHADLAVATLREAIRAGFVNLQAARSEPAFDPVRERGDFRELLASLEKVADIQRLASGNAGSSEQTLADRQQAVALIRALDPASTAGLQQRATLAATLQSIGEIQTGLKQFTEAEKSLQDAADLWRVLAESKDAKPEFQVDRIRAQISQGTLYRDSGRGAEAHRAWQACLAALEQLRTRYPGNALLENRVAQAEYEVCGIYGRLGAFSLAANYTRRNLELQRVTMPVLDLDAGIVLAVVDGDDALRALCQLVDRRRINQGNSSWLPGSLRNLGKVCNLPNPPALPPEQSLEWIEALARTDPGLWHLYLLALAQHRAGKSAEALATFEKIAGAGDYDSLSKTSDLTLGIAFAGALIAQGAGRSELARERLDKAEAIFIDYCRQSLQQTTIGLAPPLSVDGHWWEFTAAVLLRREAWRMIADGAVADDAWLHLIEARACHLLGDSARRDEQLAAAESRDDALWQARLNLSEEMDPTGQLAESVWQRFVELAAEDPLPWIQRGRWYAERGEHEKADADFTRAASLTPNELNRFLETGWWVAGPYTANLDEFCPPEIDADPSKPVFVDDPQSGLSEQPVAWRHAPAGRFGELNLPEVFNGLPGSAYALAYIYAPVECTRLLRVGDAKAVHIWCNGRLVFDTDDALSTNEVAASRVPVSLRQGRNEVLLRAGLDAPLTIRVADTPVDQVLTFGEQGLWQEAADAAFVNERNVFGEPVHDQGYFASIQLALVSGDEQVLQREGDRLLAMSLGDPSLWNQVRAATTLVMVENPLGREHAAKLQAALEKQLPVTSGDRYQNADCLRALVGCATLLGHTDAARKYLRQLQGGSEKVFSNFAQWAIVKEREGHHDEAIATLELGLQSVVSQSSQWYWPWLVENLVRLREAERQLTGSTVRTEEIIADQRKSALADWEQRDPSTAAFDHVVTTSARTGDPTAIRAALLARGGRLAELGRFDEARADFDHAVQLAPKDPDVLTARGAFHRDYGDADLAAADFHAALNLLTEPDRPRWLWGVPIDLEAAQSDEVFEKFAALRPDWDQYHWSVRVAVLMYHGDLAGAQAAARQLTHAGQWNVRTAVALLRGDREEFENLRLPANQPGYPLFQTLALALGPTEVPLTAELLAAARQLEEAQPEGASVGVDQYARFWLAVAKLRCGQAREAVNEVETLLREHRAEWARGLGWPVLAIGYQKLGEPDAARNWLAKSDLWCQWHSRETSLDACRLFGPGKILTHDWLYALVFHREARLLMDGPEALARDDAQRSARQAESRQEFSRRTAAAWQRTVDRAGDDPLPWIRRGRWYAEHGEQEKADADFAKAASLTPKELNKFLEAGWWVLGPYPANREQFCPPEIDPDPSRPVYVIDPQTGLSDEPVAWRHVETRSPSGVVGLGDRFGPPDNRSVYALTIVYSPDERTATLWLDDDHRVWVNGKPLEKSTQPGTWHWGPSHRFPCVLRAGRNSILIKKGPGEAFSARLGDNPYDQGLEFYRFGLFAEAAERFAEAERREPPGLQNLEIVDIGRHHAIAQLADGNFDEYRRLTTRLVERYGGSTHFYHLATIVSAACMGPDGLAADKLTTVLEAWKSQHPLETEPWQVVPTALIDYRLEHFGEVIRALESHHDDSAACVALAMVSFRQGNATEANEWLERARAYVEAHLSNPEGPTADYIEWPTLIYREACRLIKGESADFDARFAHFRDVRRRLWQEREPPLADFIDAVRAASAQPQVYLARGRRLAELGRFDEARADFDHAVQLAPNDPDVLTARGAFHRDDGDADLAAADFHAALNLLTDPAKPRYQWGEPIDLEATRSAEVFEKFAALRPDSDQRHWVVRTAELVRDGDLNGAQAAAQRLTQFNHRPVRAAVALLQGDREEFERLRSSVNQQDEPIFQTILLALGPTEEPLTAELLAAAQHLKEEKLQGRSSGTNYYARFWLAVAKLRAGQEREAVNEVETLLRETGAEYARGLGWPVLAIGYQKLGEPDAARRWLAKSELWSRWHSREASPDACRLFGPGKGLTRDWLYALVLHREAQTLIGADPPPADGNSGIRPKN